MDIEWYGQSAFRLSTPETTVMIDPFGDLSPMRERGMRWDYPAIEGVNADLLLVTHEHFDHNGVEAVGGEPVILRSTAGKLDSPVGEVIAIASEHDEAAGTERGPNTVFVFELDGLRVCHFGDFGQSNLRDEQTAAIGSVDLLILPVGGGPTIGAQQAHEIADRLGPRWVLPMHYRTDRIEFLEPVDEFRDRATHAHHLERPLFEVAQLTAQDAPVVVIPAAP